MGTVLLLTKALQPSADVLPGLALLSHQVKILPAEGSALLEAPDHDLLMVDGRRELAHARDLCRLIRTTGSDQPVLLIVTEGGLAVVAADWGMDDVILETAGPAEIDARIRVAIGRLAARSTTSRTPTPTSSVPARWWWTRRRTPPSSAAACSTSPSRSSSCSSTSPSTPAACSRATSCCRRCGATTTSAAPAPSTSTYAACGPSSAPTTRC